MNVEPQNTISDHMVVSLKMLVDAIAKNKTVISFRSFISINVIDFSNNLLNNYEKMRVAICTYLINISSMCLNCKTKIYRIVVSSYINQKTPIISKEITLKETGGRW